MSPNLNFIPMLNFDLGTSTAPIILNGCCGTLLITTSFSSTSPSINITMSSTLCISTAVESLFVCSSSGVGSLAVLYPSGTGISVFSMVHEVLPTKGNSHKILFSEGNSQSKSLMFVYTSGYW